MVYFIKSRKSLLSPEYLENNYFLNRLFEGKMIQRGEPYLFFENFERKKILIFKILNSLLMVYVIKSPKSLLSLEYHKKIYFLNPHFEGKMIQRGDPYILFREFQEKKKY